MRKAVLFTMAAFIIGLIVITVYTTLNYKDYYLETRINTIKIGTLNELYSDYKRYAEISVSTSLRKTLNAAALQINETKKFYSDNTTFFAVVNYCLNNDTSSCNLFDKGAEPVVGYMEEIKRLLENESVLVDYRINQITFRGQEDPWHLRVDLNISLNLTTPLASWNNNLVENLSVPIDGLIDPLILNLTGKEQVIKRSLYSFTGGTGNYTKFLDFKKNKWYRDSTRAPSFIDRFYLSLNPSDIGIETFINESDVVVNRSRSYIDYLYVNGNYFECFQLYNFTGLSPDFILDGDSAAIYLGSDMASYSSPLC